MKVLLKSLYLVFGSVIRFGEMFVLFGNVCVVFFIENVFG